MTKTKCDLAIVIMMALFNVTEEKAKHMADTKHGEFLLMMKAPKTHLEYMYETALRVLAERSWYPAK